MKTIRTAIFSCTLLLAVGAFACNTLAAANRRNSPNSSSPRQASLHKLSHRRPGNQQPQGAQPGQRAQH